MHEFHIVEGLIKEVLAKAKSAGAKKVTEVALVMGGSCGFEESSVRLYSSWLNSIAKNKYVSITVRSTCLVSNNDACF